MIPASLARARASLASLSLGGHPRHAQLPSSSNRRYRATEMLGEASVKAADTLDQPVSCFYNGADFFGLGFESANLSEM